MESSCHRKPSACDPARPFRSADVVAAMLDEFEALRDNVVAAALRFYEPAIY